MDTPHYVRFARSLALLGPVLVAAGCGETNTPTDAAAGADAFSATDAFVAADTTSAPVDAFRAADAPVLMADAFSVDDAGPVPTDAFDMCSTCTCLGFGPPEDTGTDAGLPDCNTNPGTSICCAAIGPLMPPDLVV